jgi:hypothetical protein
MSAREMKSDIKPLCDRHLNEMEAVALRTKMGGSDVWTSTVFRCAEVGCARVFDSGGYISVSDGSIDPRTRNFVGCEDGAMFIESVDDGLLIWRCCKVGCGRSRTTERAFHSVPDSFLRHAGAITGGPPDFSSRKGYSKQ